MKNVVLLANAVPVYEFLSVIAKSNAQDEKSPPKNILDCGAGGMVPPLALFNQHGYEAWGIDTSKEQLDKANKFCIEQNVELHLSAGDIRSIPFEDETFDYVYEHYTMCHLSKQDSALAVSEMYRVLKKQGLCYLGVISTDSCPKSLFGKEKKSGEYWTTERGEESISHTMFTDQEADELVSAWKILTKEKRIRYLREAAMEMSSEKWMELYEEIGDRYSKDDWQSRYKLRANAFLYAHLYFVLEKS